MTITSERAALIPLVDNVKKCVFKHAKDERETEQNKWESGYLYINEDININDSVNTVLDYIFINTTFKGAIL